MWELNFATLLLACNVLFVRVIELSASFIALFRAAIAAVALILFILATKKSVHFRRRREYVLIFLIGLIYCAHWLTFFHAAKVSTAAVAMISVFTFPIMTVFLEPWFFRQKIHLIDVILALAVLFGVVLIVPEFSLQNNIANGVLFALISALLYSFRNIFIKKYFNNYSSAVLMFYHVLTVAVVLFPLLLFYDFSLSSRDLVYLILLGVIFTAFAHTLFVKSLSQLKAKTASIITGIQPVYSTILAIFILDEISDLRVLFGGILIVAAVIFESLKYEREVFVAVE